jgi:M6 family metalloprotease-like protein
MRASNPILRLLALAACILLGASYNPLPTPGATPKKIAVIFLKHAPPFCASAAACEPHYPPEVQEAVLPPRHTADDYADLLNAQVGGYFREVSFGKVKLAFEAVRNPESADGWFAAPHRLDEYNDPALASLTQDGLDLAHSVLGGAIRDYDILLVIHNIHGLKGFALMCTPYQPGEDVSCQVTAGGEPVVMGLTAVGELSEDERLLTVISHELGHLHGLEHTVMGPYDLMGSCEVFSHFGGWSKWMAGWVSNPAELPCGEGACALVTRLTPLEEPGENHLARITLNEASFNTYLVECRTRTGYDENLPKEGVVMTKVETHPGQGTTAEIMFLPGGTDYSEAALSAGEAFVDATEGITVSHLSTDSEKGCLVRLERGAVSVPDPYIKKGVVAEAAGGGCKHTSRYIWVDSGENGWDIYPEKAPVTRIAWQPVPWTDGDPILVGEEHRIRFIIRNTGYGTAEDVRVNVYVRQPAGAAGGDCPAEGERGSLAGSVIIERLEKGEIYFGSVPWTPESGAPALVSVAIADYPNELSHANNTACETYFPAAE